MSYTWNEQEHGIISKHCRKLERQFNKIIIKFCKKEFAKQQEFLIVWENWLLFILSCITIFKLKCYNYQNDITFKILMQKKTLLNFVRQFGNSFT